LTRPNTLLHTQTDRQSNVHTHIHTDRQTCTDTVQVLTHFTGTHRVDTAKHTAAHTDRHTDRQADMHRDIDRQTCTDIQTD